MATLVMAALKIASLEMATLVMATLEMVKKCIVRMSRFVPFCPAPKKVPFKKCLSAGQNGTLPPPPPLTSWTVRKKFRHLVW